MAADDFLDSRGMGEAQGKKVDPSAIAVQAIEAQPAFGQIKPMRGQVLACTEQHCRRRASYLSARTRGSEPKEKEEKPQRTECATVIEADRTNGDEYRIRDCRLLTRSPRYDRNGPSRQRLCVRHERCQLSACPRPKQHGARRSPVRGHRSQRWSLWQPSRTNANALSQSWGCQHPHARPSGASNRHSANQSRYFPPPF